MDPSIRNQICTRPSNKRMPPVPKLLSLSSMIAMAMKRRKLRRSHHQALPSHFFELVLSLGKRFVNCLYCLLTPMFSSSHRSRSTSTAASGKRSSKSQTPAGENGMTASTWLDQSDFVASTKIKAVIEHLLVTKAEELVTVRL